MNSNNDIYKDEISDTYSFIPNQSLLELIVFYENHFNTNKSTKSALEIGCGAGLHIDSKSYLLEVEGLDSSPIATDYLSSSSTHNIYNADFLQFNPGKYWDLILDAHMLHCLIGKESFKAYFDQINKCLINGGHLLLELMCQSRGMEFDTTQRYNEETGILYQNEQAVRTILSSRDIEELIIESGLKIVYLRVDEIIKFIPNSHRSESRPTDPDRMRIICLKE